MKERPILFSGPMVRAILEGRKTQTRRIIKPQPEFEFHGVPVLKAHEVGEKSSPIKCPYGKPGDRIWVRETWRKAFQETQCSLGIIYRADKSLSLGMDEYSDRHKWKPSIHMPRWASRIDLEISSIRAERIQDITEDDAKAEGVEPFAPGDGRYVGGFKELWDSIHGPSSWDLNPWVWVVEFRRVKP